MAQRNFTEWYLAADAERRERIAEECEHWDEIRARLIFLRADAARTGRPPQVPHPHADDIVIDPEQGVRFIGPLNEADQANLEETIRMRDLLLVQYHYDQRECDQGGHDGAQNESVATAVFAHALNDLLPERYRLSNTDMVIRLMALNKLTKRQLRTKLYQEWKAQGRPVPRGKTFGSLSDAERVLTLTYDTLRDALKGNAG